MIMFVLMSNEMIFETVLSTKCKTVYQNEIEHILDNGFFVGILLKEGIDSK